MAYPSPTTHGGNTYSSIASHVTLAVNVGKRVNVWQVLNMYDTDLVSSDNSQHHSINL